MKTDIDPAAGAGEKPAALPVELTIIRQGDIPSLRIPESRASGVLRAEALLQSGTDAENTAYRVTYEPGARSAWHSHPCGQILIILSGRCLVRKRNGTLQTADAGDLVWIAPGEAHWHGAGPERSMEYISIQAVRDGTAVSWLEHVRSDTA